MDDSIGKKYIFYTKKPTQVQGSSFDYESQKLIKKYIYIKMN
jgi:hypothetical protein